MIHRLWIENFFSVREQQVLDLRIAANAPDLPRFRRSAARDDVRLPTIVALFGPNASGKTTVLRALHALQAFALHSFDLNLLPSNPSIRPFQRADKWQQPIRLAVEFDSVWGESSRPAMFRYEVAIEFPVDGTSVVVAVENLHWSHGMKMRKMFSRDHQKISVSRDFMIGMNDPRLESIRSNASVISTLSKFNHSVSNSLYELINNVKTNIVGYSRYKDETQNMLKYYLNKPRALMDLNRELPRFDLGLQRMEIHNLNGNLFVGFIHEALDAPLPIEAESAGTRRLIDLFQVLHYAIETGGIVVLDELDSDLHPVLLSEIFRWFHFPEKNRHNAQLFLTAHNAGLMDELEKEEIFFTEKDSTAATRLYGAQDIRGLRREPSLTRRYLRGEMGAVPSVG